ncbi:MAG: hypothetical protein JWP30_1810 [Homoserinimonas sp.]|nr:hypothetical protein [Homoserinimonas sp.]
MTLRIGILGLGEAGMVFAGGLSAQASVTGFDPLGAGEDTPFAVAGSASEAVHDADIVLAFTSAPDATGALTSAVDHMPADAIYLDLATGSPALKLALAEKAHAAGVGFADGAIMAPVLAARIATPILASGSQAKKASELLTPFGLRICALEGPAGAAAARKLTRSIVVKGLTALMVESLRSAEDQDILEWFSAHLAETLSELNPDSIRRLLDGTLQHSARRIHEMEAAVEMIESTGGSADMTRATVATLTSIDAIGIPRAGRLA